MENLPSSAHATAAVGKTSRLRLAVLSLLWVGLFTGQPNPCRAQTPDDFNPAPNGPVYGLAVQPDGKVLVGGGFTTVAGEYRTSIARFHLDGTLDTAFNTPDNLGATSFAVQKDGKIVVAGNVKDLRGRYYPRLNRLLPNGALEKSFSELYRPTEGGGLRAIGLQPDGKILVGGTFVVGGSNQDTDIARFNTDLTLDSSFHTSAYGNFESGVDVLVLQPDGRILVGGNIHSLAGQPRQGIGRINADGSLDASFDAHAEGAVYTMVLQPDGNILVGGYLTALGMQPRKNLGRLHPDGSLDASFNPQADDLVLSMALQADGKILVGGRFTTLNGQPRNGLGRLHGDGSLDLSFNPNVPGVVNAIALQHDGRFLVGGGFAMVGGQARQNLARLSNPDPANQTLSYEGGDLTWLRGGSAPEIWHSSFEYSSDQSTWQKLGEGQRIVGGWRLSGIQLPGQVSVRALGEVVHDGRSASRVVNGYGVPVIIEQPTTRTNLYGSIAEFRVRVGGTAPLSYQWLRNEIPLANSARLTGADTATLRISPVDKSEEGRFQAIVTTPFGSVTSLVANLTVVDPLITQQPIGTNLIPGQSLTLTSKAVGTPPLSYQWVRDGTPIVGAVAESLPLPSISNSEAGAYTVVVSNPHGSVESDPAVIVVDSGTVAVDPVFNLAADGPILVLVPQTDGKILVGGAFVSLQSGRQRRSRIARVESDSTLDLSFNPGADGTVQCMALQPDGKILVGGAFNFLGNQPRKHIGRLNSDGTVDAGFRAEANREVRSMVIQPDGKILVFSDFSTTSSQPSIGLSRLNSDGSADTDFRPPSLEGGFGSIALQSDGKIWVGGSHVFRLNSDGSLDNRVKVAALGWIYSGGPTPSPNVKLTLQPDGKVIMSGGFQSIGEVARPGLARLLADGSLDGSFNPSGEIGGLNPYDFLASVVLQSDGRVLLGGTFTINGSPAQNYLARLHSDGSLDRTFTIGAGAFVRCLAIQPDGQILVGGEFLTLAGQSRKYAGRLKNTAPATESLTREGNVVMWIRGGTSPSVPRATLDYTSDGSIWSTIGVGEWLPGGWRWDAGGVPANATLRVRGWTSGGFESGSGWFAEASVGVPVVLSKSAPATAVAGTKVTFQVVAGGDRPMRYQWFKDGTPLEAQSNAQETTNAILTLNPVSKLDDGVYTVQLSNGFGTRLFSVTTLQVADPFIAQQPASANRTAGENVFLIATVLASSPLTYQWYHDGVVVPQGTESTLILSGLSKSDAGEYRLVASSAQGSVTSSPALLTVNGALLRVDANFRPVADGYVASIIHQLDGKILVGGAFKTMAGLARPGLARLNTNGTIDATFNANIRGGDYPAVNSLASQADGRILIAGDFSTVGVRTRGGLARLNPNGTVDDSFAPSIGTNQAIGCVAIQRDGRILIAGLFEKVNQQPRRNLARLHADGSLDDSFVAEVGVPGDGSGIASLAVQNDGKILVGGWRFESIGGEPRNCFGRLNSDGSVDATFVPIPLVGSLPMIYTIAIQPDSKIIVGGTFVALGGQARSCLARLHPDGSLDTAFDAGVTGFPASLQVRTVVHQADGKILVGGTYDTLRGLPRSNLGRLNPDGSVDRSFDPSADGQVIALTLDPSGQVLVGGSFYAIGIQRREKIARLLNTDAATESLTTEGHKMSWMRGVTAPEVSSTVFDYTLDGSSWITLGSGTRIPGGWEVASSDLPEAGVTVRARGLVEASRATWLVESRLEVPPAIVLNLIPEGGRARLTWTGGRSPFQVEESEDISQPSSWRPIGAPTANRSITLNIRTRSTFLRVRGQ